MRKPLRLSIVVAAFAALAFVPAALAAQAHFIDNQPNASDPSCTWDGGNTITCSFKIAGLGNVSAVKASIEVTRTCTVSGASQNEPPGQVRSRPVTLQVENGNVTTEGDGQVFTFKKLACPGNQTTDLGDVEFFINNKSIGTVPLTIV